jgi:hypothetical protein
MHAEGIMRPQGFKTGLLLVLAWVLLGLASCICPRPGFVGVPEKVERSPDFPLPLTDADQNVLLGFLINKERPPRGWSLDDEDPGVVQAIRKEYGPLLEVLANRAPTRDDLRGGTGEVAQLFDDPTWVLSVHDARVGQDESGGFYDLDSERARALVKGEFVFAFYLRRLEAVAVSGQRVPALGIPAGTVWVLGDERPGVYTGLVVFHKTFAVPTRAE